MPAVTFRPSDNIAFANRLASISVGNDFVSLPRITTEEEKRKRKCFGVSTETNQWLVIELYLAKVVAVAVCGKNITQELFDNDPNNCVQPHRIIGN